MISSAPQRQEEEIIMQSLTWVREQGFGGLMLKSIPKEPGAGINKEGLSFSKLQSVSALKKENMDAQT